MVNASLNWASIVGIVLAVSGAGLYFLRSFKPALARDYDVFFAAIGLLCGGILFFQGWRLDPILQFGQFLLAGTTVFFAYESVRLRGIATDQARRSSYFEEEEEPSFPPSSGMGGRWDNSYDQFDEAQPINRRFLDREGSNDYDLPERDGYRSRRTSRAAIPEQAASRNLRTSVDMESVQARRKARFRTNEEDANARSTFGERRSIRQDQRRGSRPSSNSQRNRPARKFSEEDPLKTNRRDIEPGSNRFSGPKGSPLMNQPEDAAFTPPRTRSSRSTSERNKSQSKASSFNQSSRIADADSIKRRYSNRPKPKQPRDNSSRFDD